MSWASWTTRGVFAGRDGVMTGEAGHALTGELDIHTTWTEADGLAHVTVQYSGASDWLPSQEAPSRAPARTRAAPCMTRSSTPYAAERPSLGTGRF